MHFFKPKAARLTALFTAIIFSLSYGSALALDDEYSQTHTLGQDTTYTQTYGTNASGNQSINIIEYEPNNGVTPMIAYGSKLYGTSTINTVAKYLESAGHKVVAGINADFFDTASGVPIGIVIRDGAVVSSNLNMPAIGFTAEGNAVIGTPTQTMTLSGAAGSVVVNNLNKGRSNSTVCLYDENYGSTTKHTTVGTNVLLQKVNKTDIIAVNSSIQLEVLAITTDQTAVPMAEGQLVLSIAENGPLDRLPAFQVGDILEFSVTSADTSWDEVQYAVGGKVLLNDGVVDTTGSPTGKNPRSAVGIKADGTIVLYQVDGRQSSHSVGMTMDELAAEMLALGCVDAINLDGGGSSAMVVRLPGEETSAIVNSPSDGSARKCANYIMLVTEAGNGSAMSLHTYPDYYYALPGATVTFNTKAADNKSNAANFSGSINYTVSSGSGTMEDNKLTVGDSSSVTVRASGGGLSTTRTITVLEDITAVKIAKSGSTTSLAKLEMEQGSTIDLDIIKAQYKNIPLAFSDSAFTWSVDNALATVDQNGKITAKAAGDVNLTVSYGSFKQTLPVSIVANLAKSDSRVLNDFEQYTFFAADRGNIKLQTGSDYVSRGEKSLKFYYNFGEATTANLIYTASSGIEANDKYIYLQAKGDGSGLKLSAVFTDGSGNEQEVVLCPSLSGDVYQQFSAEIPAGAVYFNGLRIEKGIKASGSIYIDQIVLSKNATADSTAPSIIYSSQNTSISAGSSTSVVASITDENGTVIPDKSQIFVTVDGKEISFTQNAANGNISFSTGNLSAGLHRVCVEAVDNFGNRTRAAYDLTAGTASQMFADVSENWATKYINYAGSLGLVTGSTENGITNFRPKANLSRAEFAVIMARYLGISSDAELPYADKAKVPGWAKEAVSGLYQAGVMSGSTKGGKLYFNATANITRQEVMTAIAKALPRGYASTSTSFADASLIGGWALPHINYLYSLGIVSGNNFNQINPTGNITREEITKIISCLY